METLFTKLCTTVFKELQADEVLVINLEAENSLFIRFNKSKVRQASDVIQKKLSFCLKSQRKETSQSFPISGNEEQDLDACMNCLNQLRERIKGLDFQAFMVSAKNNGQSRSVYHADLPSSEEYLKVIIGGCSNVDMAGQLISGEVICANTNSLGQYHWFQSSSFCFDYSLYSEKEKAVKASYSGIDFNRVGFLENLSAAKQCLSYMLLDNKVLEPGRYRCYLAPAAVNELLGTLSWGGLSQSALERGNSPIQAMGKNGLEFSEKFSITEAFTLALHPRFNEEGEVANEELPLIEHGEVKNLLCSTKTANEYGLSSNFATENEVLRSPVVGTGTLAQSEILSKLGNGLYISNLHYLNWSDEKKGRITGMTRFACFWVENGEIVAPIKDLRFDETIFNMWGKNLERVTDFSVNHLNIDTYYQRGLGGSRCPGMLVKDFNFTL